jgi:hypothetical protein
MSRKPGRPLEYESFQIHRTVWEIIRLLWLERGYERCWEHHAGRAMLGGEEPRYLTYLRAEALQRIRPFNTWRYDRRYRKQRREQFNYARKRILSGASERTMRTLKALFRMLARLRRLRTPNLFAHMAQLTKGENNAE